MEIKLNKNNKDMELYAGDFLVKGDEVLTIISDNSDFNNSFYLVDWSTFSIVEGGVSLSYIANIYRDQMSYNVYSSDDFKLIQL